METHKIFMLERRGQADQSAAFCWTPYCMMLTHAAKKLGTSSQLVDLTVEGSRQSKIHLNLQFSASRLIFLSLLTIEPRNYSFCFYTGELVQRPIPTVGWKSSFLFLPVEIQLQKSDESDFAATFVTLLKASWCENFKPKSTLKVLEHLSDGSLDLLRKKYSFLN